MSTFALKLYSTMMTITAAPAKKDEKGQGTLEYLGIVIIAALLVTAIVTAVKGVHIDTVVHDQIQKIIDLGKG
ncbi:MAG: hypothetical protein QOJ72_2056 [Nocardioidaceae bacterium]|nr:hypothetical protein [Nocardioidaceae bacterium]